MLKDRCADIILRLCGVILPPLDVLELNAETIIGLLLFAVMIPLEILLVNVLIKDYIYNPCFDYACNACMQNHIYIYSINNVRLIYIGPKGKKKKLYIFKL